ncbi:Calx-beta domain-containing protein [Phenylobacterium sp.]|uniref:Calx-beta domain-containing protein n=1 Tax=Phenylobacterium sp. TaxID=1871053 RepID=UPI0035B1506A
MLLDRDGPGAAHAPEAVFALAGVNGGLSWSDVAAARVSSRFSLGLVADRINEADGGFDLVMTRANATAWDHATWSIGHGSEDLDLRGSDFPGGRHPSGTVIFAPGETRKVIHVDLLNDTVPEDTKDFRVVLNGFSGQQGWVYDDDTGAIVRLVRVDADTAEGSGAPGLMRIEVLRQGPTDGTTVVGWRTEAFGALSADPLDFLGGAFPSGTLTFAPGDTTKTIVIELAGDTAVEPEEGFLVKLDANVTGGRIMGGESEMVVGILNDDAWTQDQEIRASGPESQLRGGSGNDTLYASGGGDRMEGGPGADRFLFGTEPWKPHLIVDFKPGVDALDVSAVFRAAGYTGADPVADRYVKLLAQGRDTLVLFDRDGAGPSPEWPNYVLKLQGVQTAGLTWAQLTTAAAEPEPPPPPPPPPDPEPEPQPEPSNEGETFRSPGPGSTLTGGAGDDAFYASRGDDVITGGAGADRLVIEAEPWSPIVIRDFTVGTDRLDLSALLREWNYAGSNPVADRYVELRASGSDTLVLVDRDALGPNPQWGNYILKLEGVPAGGLTWSKLTGGSGGSGSGGSGSGGSQPPPTTNPPPSGSGSDAAPGQLLVSDQYGDALAGGSGADTLRAGQGPDRLTGGAGGDHFVFRDLPWNAGAVADFTPGLDVLDLRPLFHAAGYAGSNPLSDGRLEFRPDGQGGTQVYVDRDAAGAGDWPFLVTTLSGVAPSQLGAADWLF